MMTLSRILFPTSLAWLVVLGLHWSAWLVRPLFPAARWVRQLAELPLPPPSSAAPWPILLGVGGLLAALALSSRAARLKKEREERSEA